MDERAMETPPRKRSRTETPSSTSPSRNHVNKRFRPNFPPSQSPKAVHFDPSNLEEEDTIHESDVPESPIALTKVSTTPPPLPLSVSFASLLPFTPTVEMNDP